MDMFPTMETVGLHPILIFAGLEPVRNFCFIVVTKKKNQKNKKSALMKSYIFQLYDP